MLRSYSIMMRSRRKKERKSFQFQPFSTKQKKLMYFWEDGSPYQDADMIIADGAIRSGKTIAMICGFIRWSLANFRGENFILAGKTIGALKKNVIEPMQQILRAWDLNYHYNRSENFLTIGPNTYYMYDASNEKSQDKLQGLTAAGALADEVALFPKSFVDQMIGRCSVDGSKVFMNCNPGNPYHYVKTEFIDKAKEKHILYLHFNMDDNLSLSEKVKDRFRRMFSGVFFKRYILGLWVQAEGLIYDMFTNKHKVSKIFIDTNLRFDKYYVSCDYGTQNATVFLLWAHREHDDKWYAIKEYYYSGREKGKQKTDGEYYEDLEDFCGNKPIEAIIIDPSAASFIALIKKKKKFRVKRAKNDVSLGIRNVSTALNSMWILFSDVCHNTFKEFSTYIWDDKAIERGEDKPQKENDHAMDAIRYFVNTILMHNITRPYDDSIYDKGMGKKVINTLSNKYSNAVF
jgi:PBSX family phage terminase large subunit